MGNFVIGGGTEQPALSAQGPTYVDVSTEADGQDKAVQRLVDVKAVQNALHQCFQWIPGERILLPEFGSKLQALLYEGITPATEEQIIAEIRQCVSKWEPRVEIE